MAVLIKLLGGQIISDVINDAKSFVNKNGKHILKDQMNQNVKRIKKENS